MEFLARYRSFKFEILGISIEYHPLQGNVGRLLLPLLVYSQNVSNWAFSVHTNAVRDWTWKNAKNISMSL